MEFDEILKAHGTAAKAAITRKIIGLGDRLYGKGKWEFNHSADSETNPTAKGDKYFVSVGEGLIYNSDDKGYNKAAYVWLVKDMYHEQRHGWQYTKAWNDNTGMDSVKGYTQTTNMIRRRFVGEYFPSAYYNNYSDDPSEMDAEWYGTKMALAYFEKDPIVGIKEAKEILYQFTMSEEHIHEEMLKSYKDKLHSIDDVLNLFQERSETAITEKYTITDKIEPRFSKDVSEKDLMLTRDFLNAENFEEYREVFDECKSGIKQDKIMEQVILVSQEHVVGKAPLRIQKELINCKNQMAENTDGRELHAISPKRVSYSIQNISEGIELTEEDVAAIPVDVVELTEEDVAVISIDSNDIKL